ncbi:hypothetical protein [Salibacterium aidingense]|uniref:hypothetical protein n=1 Tax=Salibacterium aidingense TaxID=384933 RepID=UPI003BD8B857
MLEKRSIVIKRRRREKRKKQTTLSLAAGLFLLGTTPYYVGNTLGQFHNKEDRADDVEACEVFPGYVQELMNSIRSHVLQMQTLHQHLPSQNLKIDSYHLSRKNLDSAGQLRSLAKDIDNQLKILKTQRSERNNDIEKTASISEDLIKEAGSLYVLLNDLQATTEIEAIYCLDNEGEYKTQKIKAGLRYLDLNHRDVTRLLDFFNNIYLEASRPDTTENILSYFENQIEKETSGRIKGMEKDINTINAAIKDLKEERQAALQAAANIEQKEKEMREKERQEQLEKEEEANKEEENSEEQEDSSDNDSSDSDQEDSGTSDENDSPDPNPSEEDNSEQEDSSDDDSSHSGQEDSGTSDENDSPDPDPSEEDNGEQEDSSDDDSSDSDQEDSGTSDVNDSPDPDPSEEDNGEQEDSSDDDSSHSDQEDSGTSDENDSPDPDPSEEDNSEQEDSSDDDSSHSDQEDSGEQDEPARDKPSNSAEEQNEDNSGTNSENPETSKDAKEEKDSSTEEAATNSKEETDQESSVSSDQVPDTSTDNEHDNTAEVHTSRSDKEDTGANAATSMQNSDLNLDQRTKHKDPEPPSFTAAEQNKEEKDQEKKADRIPDQSTAVQMNHLPRKEEV